MNRSIIVCSILFALLTTTCSKSIGFVNSEDVENKTDSRVSSDLPPVQDEHVSDPKLSSKRSLLILMPATEEKDEIDCKETEGYSQKTKRCKTPNRLTKKEEILKSIRERLKSRDQIVGAAQKNSIAKTDVYDDGKYICYCHEKNNPLSRKPQSPLKKIKPEKKADDRNTLLGSKQPKPPSANLPRRPISPKKPYSSVPQHSPNLRPKIKHPILQEKGRERVPYVRYGHRMEPEENPTKFNIPLNSAADKPDSIVGQQPIGQQSDFNEDQQAVGQSSCPSNMLGQGLSQSAENTPRNDQHEASDVYGNNLQSAHSDPSISSIDEEDTGIPADSSEAEEPNVQATNSESIQKENEPTGSGILDYSDIKEVTDSYFTSKAYSNEAEEGPTAYDDFHVTGEDQDYSMNLQSPLDDPEEAPSSGGSNVDSQNPEEAIPSAELTNLGNVGVDGGNDEERDVVVGENNPSTNDHLNQNMDYDAADKVKGATDPINEGLRSPGEIDESKQNDEGYSTNDETNQSPERGITDGSGEKGTPIGETAHPVDSEDDHIKKDEFVNESFVTEQPVGSPDPEEDPPLSESTLKDNEETKLPFCDNSLLQSTIKSVINDFANEDSSEETVGATKDEDFLPEIVGIPNLKSILTMPPIEQTIMDKVKDRLSKIITLDKKTFDSDKMTSAIRNALRHLLSAAPTPKTELPPMAVEEHQFKDGKWVTNTVTLEPRTDDKARAPTGLEKVQASVRNLLRDPAVGLQAAKHPAVQNMIVQSVKNAFDPENEESVDDSMIRSTLNEELSIMQVEDDENDEDTITESAPDLDSLDPSSIDMQKLLEIAKSGAGINEPEEHKPSSLKSLPESNFEENVGNPEVYEGNSKEDGGKESYDDGVVGTTKEEGDSMASNSEEVPEVNYKSSCSKTQPNIVAAAPENQESLIEPTGDDEDDDLDLVGMKNEGEPSLEASPEHDLTYLGKISVQNKNNEDNVQNLQDSELYYIGDGVKLPLEIRRLKDGSYALSISRKVCEHLLNKECPCCVPTKGNVVRTVRRKRISEDESTKSILSNRRRKRDLTDDSLHIFSMPVESFAKRYNLSLKLEKAQAPWNFHEMEKIDERTRNFRNKGRKNVDVDLLRDLLAVHEVSDNDQINKKRMNNNRKEDATNSQIQREKQTNFDRYRCQRNIDQNVNKRVEFVKGILNWLKDMILKASSE